MPGEDIYSWDTTAANNDDADTSINWAEGMARAAVNDSMRSEMAAHAKHRDQQIGAIVTGGTANAQIFSSGNSYVTVPTNMRVLLKIGPALTNTATTTLNMDSISDVTIKGQSGNELSGGELVADAYAEFLYNGTNWILLRSSSTSISTIIITSVGPGGTPAVPGSVDSVGGGAFTASGTYTPTPGLIYAVIEAIGGGGGGGGAAGGDGSQLRQGGGGGAGAYSRAVIAASAIGASQVVTIGAAGAAGGGGGAGGNGGTSSVGTLITAPGGTGGAHSSISYGSGGTGGVIGTGDFKVPGAPGMPGSYSEAGGVLINTANGASSMWGGGGLCGGASGGSASVGSAATGYGAGGGGATTAFIASSAGGGAGTPGLVLITEFVAL